MTLNFLRSFWEATSKLERQSAYKHVVYLFVPKLGIFKGMLARERIQSGPPIQLPLSMRKVDAALEPSWHGLAALLITKNRIHPNSTNTSVARLLDSHEETRHTRAFERKPAKRYGSTAELVSTSSTSDKETWFREAQTPMINSCLIQDWRIDGQALQQNNGEH